MQPEFGEVDASRKYAVNTSRLGDVRQDGDEECDNRVLEDEDPSNLWRTSVTLLVRRYNRQTWA